MIIVKTARGDVFVNEKETEVVIHDKEHKVVEVRSPKEGLNVYHITDVESIRYVSDKHATEWLDEGSEIEQLRGELEEKEYWISKLEFRFREVNCLRMWLEDHIKDEFDDELLKMREAMFKRINEWNEKNEKGRVNG